MTIIEQPSIVASKRLCQAWYSAWLSWSRQKMDVVGQQQIGMPCARITRLRFAKALQMREPVLIVQKAQHAVVAALNKVSRDIGEVEAREPDHVVMHSGIAPLTPWKNHI